MWTWGPRGGEEDIELAYVWAVLSSGQPTYPTPVSLHPTQYTAGPFGYAARLLVSTAGSVPSAADDRFIVNGVTIRPCDPSTTDVNPGEVLVGLLPAGNTVTLAVQNRFDPLSSGDLFITVRAISRLAATVEPAFSDVLCLLHMDGTNGGTTFTDSGPLALSITNTGSVQTLTAAAEYGTGGARFTGASGQGLGLTNSVFNLGSTYTVEWSMNTTATTGMVWCFGDETTNRTQITLAGPGASLEMPSLSMDVFNAGVIGRWEGVPNGYTKFRLVRTSSTSITLYANGASIGTKTITSGFATGTHGNGGKLYIGAKSGSNSAVMDMDEFRVSDVAINSANYIIRYNAFPDS